MKTMAKKKGRDLRSYLAAGVTMVLWASAYPGIRAGLHAYSPAHLAILRYAAASLTLGGYALVKHLRLPGFRDLAKIALLGLVGIAYYGVALNTGELSVPSAVASFLINTAPLFVALVARVWLGERLHRLGWLGMLISFSGVAVIAWSGMAGLLVDAHALLIVSAAFAFSLYVVGQKPLLTRYTAVEFATYAVWASACCLLFFFPGLPEEMRARTTPPPSCFARWTQRLARRMVAAGLVRAVEKWRFPKQWNSTSEWHAASALVSHVSCGWSRLESF